jgi:hypothetical protein
MGKSRRIAVIMAVTAAVASAAPATPASAAVQDGPRPLVNAVKAVKVGVPTWVKTFWVTHRDVCDATVTVSGARVDVLYPSNTDTYTSFRRDATLAVGDYDYTAFRVTATSKKTTVVKLKVTISYVQLPRGTFDGDVDQEAVPCTGKELARTSWVKLPVLVKK